MRNFLIVFVLWSGLAFAQDDVEGGDYENYFPAYGKSVADFVVSDYKLIASAYGDLNKDGREDVALVLEGTVPHLIEPNEGLGPKMLNFNNRTLLVLFKDAGGYKYVEHNALIIPQPNDPDAPCLADPFLESEGIAIKKGVLWLHLGYWSSCGSYGTSRQIFKLRYQVSHFRLIGYEQSDASRAGGGTNSVSVNYLSKKACIVRGGNELDDDTKSKPTTIWKDLAINELITLEQLGRPIDFEY